MGRLVTVRQAWRVVAVNVYGKGCWELTMKQNVNHGFDLMTWPE